MFSNNQVAELFDHQYQFLMEIVIKGRYHMRLTLLVGCSKVSLSFNQIAGFFDHQNIWKDSVYVLDILLKDSHQVSYSSKHF